MQVTFSDIKILLIQARDEDEILKQEQDCFIERCQIKAAQLFAFNVIDKKLAELSTVNINDYHCLMIGGSGAYSATQDYTWMPWLLQLVRKGTCPFISHLRFLLGPPNSCSCLRGNSELRQRTYGDGLSYHYAE